MSGDHRPIFTFEEGGEVRLKMEAGLARAPRVVRFPKSGHDWLSSILLAGQNRGRTVRGGGTDPAGWPSAQDFAQPKSGFVELRLGISHRTIQNLSDFVVLVTFNVVQHKHRLVSGRQLFNGAAERDSVYRVQQTLIIVPVFTLDRLVLGVVNVIE
jgi:hypothetical protein